eukprot:m.63272 g.63272  ORF g.63272 m.63272 type:complete len:632 (+) comp13964_c0_seq1:48-1943(+)
MSAIEQLKQLRASSGVSKPSLALIDQAIANLNQDGVKALVTAVDHIGSILKGLDEQEYKLLQPSLTKICETLAKMVVPKLPNMAADDLNLASKVWSDALETLPLTRGLVLLLTAIKTIRSKDKGADAALGSIVVSMVTHVTHWLYHKPASFQKVLNAVVKTVATHLKNHPPSTSDPAMVVACGALAVALLHRSPPFNGRLNTTHEETSHLGKAITLFAYVTTPEALTACLQAVPPDTASQACLHLLLASLARHQPAALENAAFTSALLHKVFSTAEQCIACYHGLLNIPPNPPQALSTAVLDGLGQGLSNTTSDDVASVVEGVLLQNLVKGTWAQQQLSLLLWLRLAQAWPPSIALAQLAAILQLVVDDISLLNPSLVELVHRLHSTVTQADIILPPATLSHAGFESQVKLLGALDQVTVQVPPLLKELAQPLMSNVLASLEHAEDTLVPDFLHGALAVLAAGDVRMALDEVTSMVTECNVEIAPHLTRCVARLLVHVPEAQGQKELLQTMTGLLQAHPSEANASNAVLLLETLLLQPLQPSNQPELEAVAEVITGIAQASSGFALAQRWVACMHAFCKQTQDVDVSRLLQAPIVPAAWMEAQLQQRPWIPVGEEGLDWQGFGNTLQTPST